MGSLRGKVTKVNHYSRLKNRKVKKKKNKKVKDSSNLSYRNRN
jgi:hypothetical protein